MHSQFDELGRRRPTDDEREFLKDTQDIVESWRQQAVKEGVDQGIARGLAHAVVRIYEVRFGAMPADLRTAVEDTREGQVLDAWLGLAGSRGADEIAAAILAARASWTKETQARFDHLRAKESAGPLTATEKAELVALTAKVEAKEAQLLDRAIVRLRGNVDALTQAVRDVESRREALARLFAQQQQLAADVRRFVAEFDHRRSFILDALARVASDL